MRSFPDQFVGELSETKWLNWLSETYVKDIRELHTTKTDTKLIVDEILQKFLKKLAELSHSDRLKMANIVESRQIPAKKPESITCLAIWRQCSIELHDGLSYDGLGHKI